MVCHWGICAPQQSTGGASCISVPSMWPGGRVDAAIWRPQSLNGENQVLTGGESGNPHFKLWDIISVTTLHTKAEEKK